MDAPGGEALSAALPHRCLVGGRRGACPLPPPSCCLCHAAWGWQGGQGSEMEQGRESGKGGKEGKT